MTCHTVWRVPDTFQKRHEITARAGIYLWEVAAVDRPPAKHFSRAKLEDWNQAPPTVSAHRYKAGQVVVLRAGGKSPHMVVQSFQKGGPIPGALWGEESPRGWVCVWFVQGARREAVFPACVLMLAPPEREPA